MPFNKQYKIIFVHIPKTAGTSIESFFHINKPENFCFYSWDRDQVSFVEKMKHLTSSKKINYEPQHYHMALLQELICNYDDYFKFTFVRNPYTKILSEYYWLKKQQLNVPLVFNQNDFHEWCKNFLSQINSSHKEPQINFIDDSIDFIGRFEYFRRDFNSLLHQLISTREELIPFKNKTLPLLNSVGQNKELLLSHILNKTKKIIYKTYKEDFEKFGYDHKL